MINAIIVDDEIATSIIIEYMIEQENLPINIINKVSSGVEAIDLIKKHKPNIVFLDINMPFMNGFEVMEKVNELNIPGINFIIITGYDLFEYAQSALRLGAKDILLKPIDLDQLKSSVNKLIGFQYTSNELINCVVLYIHEHYAEEVTLQGVAEQMHISSQYLSRVFKKYMNNNFNRYLNEYRVTNAKALLIETDKSTAEISYLVGYQSLNSFYTHFKEIVGDTPMEYRKNHKSWND